MISATAGVLTRETALWIAKGRLPKETADRRLNDHPEALAGADRITQGTEPLMRQTQPGGGGGLSQLTAAAPANATREVVA